MIATLHNILTKLLLLLSRNIENPRINFDRIVNNRIGFSVTILLPFSIRIQERRVFGNSSRNSPLIVCLTRV